MLNVDQSMNNTSGEMKRLSLEENNTPANGTPVVPMGSILSETTMYHSAASSSTPMPGSTAVKPNQVTIFATPIANIKVDCNEIVEEGEG